MFDLIGPHGSSLHVSLKDQPQASGAFSEVFIVFVHSFTPAAYTDELQRVAAKASSLP